MSGIRIADFTTNHDNINEIYDLWTRTLGDIWIIDKSKFIDCVFEKNAENLKQHNFIALNGNKIVGFIAGKSKNKDTETIGQIMIVMVDKDLQRQGIGSQLISKVNESFKQNNVTQVNLATGAGLYFWPGVPQNINGGKEFFQHLGFKFSEISVDMLGEINNYQPPKGIYDKVNDIGVNFRIANQNDSVKLLEFEKREFPDWFGYFNESVNKKDFNNILLAIKKNNEIIGSTLITLNNFIWQNMLDRKVGKFGALGVANVHRNKGIGLALASYATEKLKEGGVDYCFVGWTYLVDWYSKLGYKIWQKYDRGMMLVK